MLTVLRRWKSMLDPNEIECWRGYHGSDKCHHYKYLSRLKMKIFAVEVLYIFSLFSSHPSLLLFFLNNRYTEELLIQHTHIQANV